MRIWAPWICWLIMTLAFGVYFAMLIARIGSGTRADASTLLTPGSMTHGHHQIELACDACHTPWMSVRQDACTQCHAAELERVDDSHPTIKFEDLGKWDLVKKLDARQCITCHIEHRPEQTRAMGVTLPTDYCAHCHADVGENRATHQGLAFNTCLNSGCHNYHDNSGLFEKFLLEHINTPDVLEKPAVIQSDFLSRFMATLDQPALKPLEEYAHDAPDDQVTGTLLAEWHDTAHAKAGVNCSACHQRDNTWTHQPDHRACQSCHDRQVDGFLDSRHGMRLALNFTAMTPKQARIPMKAQAANQTMTCNACHGAHRFERRTAAVESCMACHDDTHTRAYLDSPHHRLWKKELNGTLPRGQGVSCATCHMPTITFKDEEGNGGIFVSHNPNDHLRPNAKMIRSSMHRMPWHEFHLECTG